MWHQNLEPKWDHAKPIDQEEMTETPPKTIAIENVNQSDENSPPNWEFWISALYISIANFHKKYFEKNKQSFCFLFEALYIDSQNNEWYKEQNFFGTKMKSRIFELF